MTVKIPANVLRAALVCAASRDVRYYLNGIYIDTRDPARIDIVSTDGHRMFVHRAALKDETPENLRREWILDRDDLTAALKDAESIELVDHDSEQATVFVMCKGRARRSLRKQLVQIIDGRFPKWEEVLKAALKAEAQPADISAEYIGSMGRICFLLSGVKRFQPKIVTKGTDTAALALFDDGASLALVMPLRAVEGRMPEWADAIKEAA